MRRTFSKEFKQDAVSLLIEQGYSCADAARSLDIQYGLLTRWIKEYKDDSGMRFEEKAI